MRSADGRRGLFAFPRRLAVAHGGLASAHWPVQALPLRRVALPAWAVLLLATMTLYIAVAWYFTMHLGVLNNDALIRTAQASFVAQGRDPHLGAIGFIWNPLPALVQIPLVVLLRPFGLQVFAGGLQSAVSMAVAATLLSSLLGLFSFGRAWRALLVAAFVFNPMIVLYAGTGMTEAMFLLFFIGTAYFLVRWMRTQQPSTLAGMGLMTAGAYGVRYEALPLAAAGALAIGIVWLTTTDRQRSRLVADLVLYLVPITGAVLLWMALSYLIVGDGLYFLRSQYSATTLSANFDRSTNPDAVLLREVRRSPIATLVYVAERLSKVFAAFVFVVAAAGLVLVGRRNWRIAAVVPLAVAIAAFHALLLYRGIALHFLRYYLDSIAGAFVLAPVVVDSLPGRRLRATALGLVLLGFVFSGLNQIPSMADANVGIEEYAFAERTSDEILGNHPTVQILDPHADERAIAQYLDAKGPRGLVLVDTVYGAPIVLFSAHPERFATTSDRDFSFVLENARGMVGYVLVPLATTVASLDRVNLRYPDLYAGGETWVTFEREWGAWRLYRVGPASP